MVKSGWQQATAGLKSRAAMSQSKHDDHLAEVKAVLGRLQQISRKPNGPGARTAEDGVASRGSPRPAPAEGGSSDPPRRTTSLISYLMNGPGHVKAAVLTVLLLAFFTGLAFFIGLDRPPGPIKASPSAQELPPVIGRAPAAAPGNTAPAGVPAPDAQKSAAAAALQTASDLMASGQVRAARDALLRVASDESADVAWALARSYDPNYLVTIGTSDARPNVAEATRWYRTWFEIAVKQGLVADSVSLDRIIRSMNELNAR
jgi:hypothetical protein